MMLQKYSIIVKVQTHEIFGTQFSFFFFDYSKLDAR
jgi:hypothetical protein